MARAGTLGRLTINKQDYPVLRDADISRTTGQYEKEAMATTGDPVEKFTKRVEIAENFDLGLDGTDRSNLREVANSKEPVDCAYETANGDTYTCSGHVSITGDTTMDAKVTVKIDPATAAGWTEILV